MDFIDMFCGIGTIRMGMEQAGHECVYSIEWDKHKRRIYSVIFGKEPEGRDIRNIRGTELPRADCWCFGAPCQDFSIAGKREGLEGERSSLVREVFRLLRETEEEYRPKYIIYENVKGMLSSNKGFDFLEILIEMESLCYDRIEYSLLNSKHFGVPQNRERVFTIGHLRGRSTRKVFPITGSYKSAAELQGQSLYTNTITTRTNQANGSGSYIVESKQHAQKTIKIKENTKKGYVEAYEYDGIRLDHIGGTTGRARVQPQRSNTLTTGGHAGVIDKGCRIRRLTPKETWRLQGISDTITDKVSIAGISDAQMYKGAGDACTVNVIYEIARRMA